MVVGREWHRALALGAAAAGCAYRLFTQRQVIRELGLARALASVAAAGPWPCSRAGGRAWQAAAGQAAARAGQQPGPQLVLAASPPTLEASLKHGLPSQS